MDGQVTRQIEPEHLTAAAWQSFGWLPVDDTDPIDGDQRLSFEWSDVHVNIIGHRVDEVPAVPGGLRCTELFRHLTHTQVVMPLDVPSVVAVAPPGTDPTRAGEVRAFVVPVLRSIVLHRGTWHWGPYPMTGPSVRLLNVQGLRYAEDNERIDLAAVGAAVDVAIGG